MATLPGIDGLGDIAGRPILVRSDLNVPLDGSTITDELAVADAHPLGARPFARPQYVDKFRMLADGVVTQEEQDRFLELVERLGSLSAAEVGQLDLEVDEGQLGEEAAEGIF